MDGEDSAAACVCMAIFYGWRRTAVTGSEEKIVICVASTVPMLFCSGTVIHQQQNRTRFGPCPQLCQFITLQWSDEIFAASTDSQMKELPYLRAGQIKWEQDDK